MCVCNDGWTGGDCDQDIVDCMADSCDRGTCHVSGLWPYEVGSSQ